MIEKIIAVVEIVHVIVSGAAKLLQRGADALLALLRIIEGLEVREGVAYPA
jgi:hypothetical protein